MRMSALKSLRDKLQAVEDGKSRPVPAAATTGKGGGDGLAGGKRFVNFDRPVLINSNAGVVEFLVSRNEMEGPKDEEGAAAARYAAAVSYRELRKGAEVAGLKSPDWLNTGGGGAAKSKDLGGAQYNCIMRLGEIRKVMPYPALNQLLERAVYADDWLDLYPEWNASMKVRERNKRAKERTLNALHFALDNVALVLRLLDEEQFRRRWRSGVPSPSPGARRRIRASMA